MQLEQRIVGNVAIVKVTGDITLNKGGDVILKDIFAKEREIFGAVLNTTKVYAHCPPILKAAKQLSASIEKSGQLPPALLPLVYLRVAQINGCPF